MFEMEFKLVFPSQQNGQSTAYALRNWQGKQTFAKGNEKKKKIKKIKKRNLNLNPY